MKKQHPNVEQKSVNGRHKIFVTVGGERLPLKLYAHVKRNGRTFREAAKESGIGWSALYRIENGEVPGGVNLLRLMKWMGLEVKDMSLEEG